jgi:hypothetical protein
MKEEIKQCRFIQRIDSIHLLTTKKVISYLCVVPLRRVPEERDINPGLDNKNN